MPMPRYSRADFRAALQALLPTGRIWPREEGTTQAQVLDGLGAVYERQSTDAVALLADAFPAGAQQLLPEWEETLGVGGLPTMQQRRASVVAQIIGVGGQSVPYLTAYARALGFDIDITQFGPARAGAARAGAPACDASWSFVWRIGAEAAKVTRARAGLTTAGEPLGAWGDDVLESVMRKVAAAHTLPVFSYREPPPQYGYMEILPTIAGLMGSTALSLPSFVTCSSSSLSADGLYVSSAAQVASIALSSVPGWDATQGAVVVAGRAAAAQPMGMTQGYACIHDGTNNNRIFVERGAASDSAAAAVSTGGVVQAALGIAGTTPNDTAFKAAIAWKTDDVAEAANGTLAGPDTAATIPTGLTTLLIGAALSNPAWFANSHIRRVTLYNRRLSNAELQAATSGGTVPSDAILCLDFTKVNPTTLTATNGTYDVLVTGELADGSTAKRWTSVTISTGSTTIRPLVTEARIVSIDAFGAMLTPEQKAQFADTGHTFRLVPLP